MPLDVLALVVGLVADLGTDLTLQLLGGTFSFVAAARKDLADRRRGDTARGGPPKLPR